MADIVKTTASDRLLAFIDAHQKGGCRVVSRGKACECALCDLDRMVEFIQTLEGEIHKWMDFSAHLEMCSDCAEGAVEDCSTGGALKVRALTLGGV